MNFYNSYFKLIISALTLSVLYSYKSLTVRMKSINTKLYCQSGSNIPGSVLNTPETVQAMMVRAAAGIMKSREAGVLLSIVEVPLPVTGGTEIDDW